MGSPRSVPNSTTSACRLAVQAPSPVLVASYVRPGGGSRPFFGSPPYVAPPRPGAEMGHLDANLWRSAAVSLESRGSPKRGRGHFQLARARGLSPALVRRALPNAHPTPPAMSRSRPWISLLFPFSSTTVRATRARGSPTVSARVSASSRAAPAVVVHARTRASVAGHARGARSCPCRGGLHDSVTSPLRHSNRRPRAAVQRASIALDERASAHSRARVDYSSRPACLMTRGPRLVQGRRANVLGGSVSRATGRRARVPIA